MLRSNFKDLFFPMSVKDVAEEVSYLNVCVQLVIRTTHIHIMFKVA